MMSVQDKALYIDLLSQAHSNNADLDAIIAQAKDMHYTHGQIRKLYREYQDCHEVVMLH